MNNPGLRTLDKERTRRNLLKVGAIAVSAVVLSLATTAGAIADQNNQGGNNNNQGGTKRAPAPSIGSGIPAALAVGGVLLGMKFLKRLRQS